MKVIVVFKPLQDGKTKPEDRQLIDGKYPHWIVRSEMLKLGETLQHFFIRKAEQIKQPVYKEKGVVGIYFYDVQAIGGIVGEPDKAGLMVRYDYIKEVKDNTPYTETQIGFVKD